MVTVEYASELDPLLELSPPSDWIVAVVPEPGQLLAESSLPEDRLLAQLFSTRDDEPVVATRLTFLYYRGIGSDPKSSGRDTQISVRYNLANDQYELSSVRSETTVSTADEATDWIDEQFLAVETFLHTYAVLTDLSDEIHGLGRTGVRGLVETFDTVDTVQEADVDALTDVPYVDEENATALQTALEEIEDIGEGDPTPVERELQTVDGPLILDLQEGPLPGELIPSGASEPTYRTEGFGSNDGVLSDG